MLANDHSLQGKVSVNIPVHIVTPPGSSRPPERTSPHIAVGLEMIQQPLDGSLAHVVRSTSKLSQDTELAVGAEPCSGILDALHANISRHASRAGSGAVAIEILVHLVDHLVLRVLEVDQAGSVAAGDPGPGTAPCVALDKDVLRCSTSCTNGVDSCLVEVENEALVHGVVFVVSVEDDFGIGNEMSGELGPEALEIVGVGDDLAVVATIIVWVQDSIRAGICDVVDALGEVSEVGGVKVGRQGGLRQALHGEAHAEDVVSLVNQSLYSLMLAHVNHLANGIPHVSYLDGRVGREDEVGAPRARVSILSELPTSFVDTEPFELAGRNTRRRCRRTRGCGCRQGGFRSGSGGRSTGQALAIPGV